MRKVFMLVLVFWAAAFSYAQKKPDWANSIGVAQDSKTVFSVSTGGSRQEAETAALGALAAYFRQSVETSTTLSDWSIEGGASRSEGQTRTETRAALDSLSGVETQVWQDTRAQTWYAICVLDKASGRAAYAALLDAALREAAALLAGVKPGTLQALGASRKARTDADKAETYAAVLARLDGADRRREAATFRAKAAEAEAAARANVSVTLRIKGDVDGRIAAAFAGAFAALGVTATGPTGRYTLEAHLTLTPLGKPGRYWETRYTVDAILRDTQTGTELLHWAPSDRESHPASQDGATSRALLTLEETITSDFAARLAAYLGE